MKRQIYSSYNTTGTAESANKKAGIIKFGRNDFVQLDNGWAVELTTGVVRYNVNTNEVSNYINAAIYASEVAEMKVSSTRRGKYNYAEDLRAELRGYTAEEFEDFMYMAQNATYEELDNLFPRTWD